MNQTEIEYKTLAASHEMAESAVGLASRASGPAFDLLEQSLAPSTWRRSLGEKALGTRLGGSIGEGEKPEAVMNNTGRVRKFLRHVAMNPKARDADGDGIVQEGTDQARSVEKKPKGIAARAARAADRLDVTGHERGQIAAAPKAPRRKKKGPVARIQAAAAREADHLDVTGHEHGRAADHREPPSRSMPKKPRKGVRTRVAEAAAREADQLDVTGQEQGKIKKPAKAPRKRVVGDAAGHMSVGKEKRRSARVEAAHVPQPWAAPKLKGDGKINDVQREVVAKEAQTQLGVLDRTWRTRLFLRANEPVNPDAIAAYVREHERVKGPNDNRLQRLHKDQADHALLIEAIHAHENNGDLSKLADLQHQLSPSRAAPMKQAMQENEDQPDISSGVKRGALERFANFDKPDRFDAEQSDLNNLIAAQQMNVNSIRVRLEHATLQPGHKARLEASLVASKKAIAEHKAELRALEEARKNFEEERKRIAAAAEQERIARLADARARMEKPLSKKEKAAVESHLHPDSYPHNDGFFQTRAGQRQLKSGLMVPLRVEVGNKGITSTDQAVKHLTMGESIDDVPDDFLRDAIFENMDTSVRHGEGRRFKRLKIGNGINENNAPSERDKTFGIEDTVTGRKYILKSPSQFPAETAGELFEAGLGQMAGAPVGRIRLATAPKTRLNGDNVSMLFEHAADVYGSPSVQGGDYAAKSEGTDFGKQLMKIIDFHLTAGGAGADRHGGNYMWATNGKTQIIPIDHGISYGGDIRPAEAEQVLNDNPKIKESLEKISKADLNEFDAAMKDVFEPYLANNAILADRVERHTKNLHILIEAAGGGK